MANRVHISEMIEDGRRFFEDLTEISHRKDRIIEEEV